MAEANTSIIPVPPKNLHNAVIFTFFMKNIEMSTVELQRKVVAKFNKSEIQHYSVQTEFEHGLTMDLAWQLNGIEMPTIGSQNAPKRFDYDVLVFLDVDAVPLTAGALDYIVERAAVGQVIIGDVQNSNHIQNDKHLFVAPSVMAISTDTFVAMGKPSARPTSRADVAEEYTFHAEKYKVPVEFFLPLSYEESPTEKAYWDLQNESIPEQFRKYGRGTTFGTPAINEPDRGQSEVSLFWHAFQSFHPGWKEKIPVKFESILNG